MKDQLRKGHFEFGLQILKKRAVPWKGFLRLKKRIRLLDVFKLK